MTAWSIEPLEDCLDVLIDYRGKSPTKSQTGIPVLSAKVVKTSGLLHPIEQTIAPEYYPTWMTRGLPRPGDVVMTTEAPLGEVIQLDEQTATFALGQRIVCLRGKKDKLDNTFLRYLLTSPQQQALLEARATGTTVLGISQKTLRSMPISFPEIAEQRRIGSLLAGLDDKIELNRRMNETLEAMARALFRDWFVDFGPTRAKMAGHAPYFSPALWDLFPDRLDDDGKPEGWKQVSVESVTHRVTKGTTPNSQQMAAATDDAAIKFLRVNNLSENGEIGLSNVIQVPQSVHETVLKRSILQGDDLLYTIAGTIGRVALVQQRFLPANINQAIAIVRPKHEVISPQILLMWLTDPIFQASLNSKIVQGVQANLSLGVLSDAPLLLPPPNVLGALTKPIEAILRRKWSNNSENETLAQTRDLLLPRLMSGELRVAEAEQTLAGVL